MGLERFMFVRSQQLPAHTTASQLHPTRLFPGSKDTQSEQRTFTKDAVAYLALGDEEKLKNGHQKQIRCIKSHIC